jgi:hypothetical protein
MTLRAPRRRSPPQALRLVIDRRVPACIVRGHYSLATMDTWLVAVDNRRPLDNWRILAMAEEIRRTGRVPGSFGLGTYEGRTYLLDGRHRREAVRMSGVGTVYAVIAWKRCTLG